MGQVAIVSVDPRDATPIYAQLERGLRAGIATGKLRPGDQLPTVRQLAVELKVNANTVARVYVELERAGVIETRRGVGSFVSATPAQAHPPREHERRLARVCDPRAGGRRAGWFRHRRSHRCAWRASSREEHRPWSPSRASRTSTSLSIAILLASIGARPVRNGPHEQSDPAGRHDRDRHRAGAGAQGREAVGARRSSSGSAGSSGFRDPDCSGSSRSSTRSRPGSISARSRPASPPNRR